MKLCDIKDDLQHKNFCKDDREELFGPELPNLSSIGTLMYVASNTGPEQHSL